MAASLSLPQHSDPVVLLHSKLPRSPWNYENNPRKQTKAQLALHGELGEAGPVKVLQSLID